MKVIIKEQNGQTGLRKPGTECEVSDFKAKLWIANGWAKQVGITKKQESDDEVPEPEKAEPKPKRKRKKADK